MFNLCKKLISEGKKPQVVLGFNAANEIFLVEDEKVIDRIPVTSRGGFR